MNNSDMQILLDVEAQLSNNLLNETKEQVKLIQQVVRNNRNKVCPTCFGQDDCSTQILSMCPWRFDCGELQS